MPIRFTGMINYDELDDIDTHPRRETIRASQKPVVSLTDNRRKVKPQRDGAHKRMMEWQRD